jgi:GAF domain-containing protein
MDLPYILASTGRAHLAAGEIQKALDFTARGVEAINDEIEGEYPSYAVWWWRYQALQAALVRRPPVMVGDSEEAWGALDQAFEIMLERIATLSDEGLRRNFLNKVPVNRAITLDWARQAFRRGLSLAPLVERETGASNLQEQLKRLVSTGVDLTAQRDLAGLPSYLLDEFVELCGAERAILVFKEERTGYRIEAATRPAEEEKAEVITLFEPFWESLQEAPLPTVNETDPGISADMPAEFQRRSQVVIPLVSQGQLLGAFYGDMRQVFGRFSQDDLDLLTLLGNQVAAALENASWTSTLEDKVEERTRSLNQRLAELAVINRVQEGLVSQLDFQAIVDLVGEEVRQIFHGQNVLISRYDEGTNKIHILYWVNFDGNRVFPEPFDYGEGLSSIVIRTRKPLVLGTAQQQDELGAIVFRDSKVEREESWLGVPILVGEKVTGVIAVQDHPQNRYGESDVRLLSTLAASMGVALENARLFEETNRLLKETEQRATELQVINSVQDALAAELSIQGIFETVGDKIREIFHQADMNIRIYDPQTDLVLYPYMYEFGQRIDYEPTQLSEGGFFAQVLRTHQTLVINENLDQEMERYGSRTLPGTQSGKSVVFVPLASGEKVRGVISLSDMEREHAFSDSDVRLLQTLANSMSVALENARLFDETQRLLKETEQRAAELAVINSVQQGLAKQLDIQAIYDLVGDQIRDLFEAQSVLIINFDLEREQRQAVYIYEKGERYYSKPAPLTGLMRYLIEHPEPLLFVEDVERRLNEIGSVQVPGTDQPKSALFVPLVVAGKVKGMISIQNIDQENAFSESDLRLLTTLAASMSVALENARLFEETKRPSCVQRPWHPNEQAIFAGGSGRSLKVDH